MYMASKMAKEQHGHLTSTTRRNAARSFKVWLPAVAAEDAGRGGVFDSRPASDCLRLAQCVDVGPFRCDRSPP